METLTLDPREPDGLNAETTDQQLPRRPRRQLFNRRSAALAALVTCAAGFYAGARIEKSQMASTPSTFTLPAGGASGLAGAAGRGGARTGATGSAGTARAAGAGAGGGAGGGFAGATGGGASFGTVQSVNGNSLVLSEASGNTVKVTLSSRTKVTKAESVKHSAVHPGDTIIVQGAANRKGTLVAATVTDSGAGRSASSGAGSGSGSGSAVGSLFSSGGGG